HILSVEPRRAAERVCDAFLAHLCPPLLPTPLPIAAPFPPKACIAAHPHWANKHSDALAHLLRHTAPCRATEATDGDTLARRDTCRHHFFGARSNWLRFRL